jgi:hypothetical protein
VEELGEFGESGRWMTRKEEKRKGKKCGYHGIRHES